MSTFEVLSFFRGTSGDCPAAHPYISHVRRDRRPKNSPMHFHHVADAWFLKRFGVKHRSSSVFLTSRIVTANTYAASPDHVIRVIPTSDYRYCWSPKVSDLIFSAEKMKSASQAEIEAHLDSLDCTDSDLNEAYRTGHEVMLNCAQFIGIPVGLLSELKPQVDERSLILLPKYY